jgi:hypothetical protein
LAVVSRKTISYCWRLASISLASIDSVQHVCCCPPLRLPQYRNLAPVQTNQSHYSFIPFTFYRQFKILESRSRDWPPKSRDRSIERSQSPAVVLHGRNDTKRHQMGRSAKGEKAKCVTALPKIALTAHYEHLSTHFKSKPCAGVFNNLNNFNGAATPHHATAQKSRMACN